MTYLTILKLALQYAPLIAKYAPQLIKLAPEILTLVGQIEADIKAMHAANPPAANNPNPTPVAK